MRQRLIDVLIVIFIAAVCTIEWGCSDGSGDCRDYAVQVDNDGPLDAGDRFDCDEAGCPVCE